MALRHDVSDKEEEEEGKKRELARPH